jgi:hypothetical protein
VKILLRFLHIILMIVCLVSLIPWGLCYPFLWIGHYILTGKHIEIDSYPDFLTYGVFYPLQKRIER